jgi:uncharacterized protein YdaT
MAKNNSHHFIPNPKGGWDIKKTGADRSSGHFENKQDAINRARQICQKQGTELVIHGKDWRIVGKLFH